MQNYPTISLAKVRTLMNKGRRNPGRPGNSTDPEKAATSKRVYGPQPGGEDVATLLFYRSAFPEKEKITTFLRENELKPGAPVEVTPAFYRYRIHKVANFDKDSLKTYRLDVAPDVLVITGSRLTAEQRKGKKATSLEFRTRTLRAAGWSITPEADRKKAATDVERAQKSLDKLLEREADSDKRVTKSDISAYARVKTAARKKAGNNNAFTEAEAQADAETVGGKAKIYDALIKAAEADLKAASKRAEKTAAPPSGGRGLPEGITSEMLANYAVLQKKWVKSEYQKTAGEIRSFAINKTAEFLATLTSITASDRAAGGTGGPTPRATQRASDAATAAAAEGADDIPRKGQVPASGGAGIARAVWDAMKKLALTALRKQGTTAQANVERAAQILAAQQKKGADAAELKEIANDLAFAFKGMKAAGKDFSTAALTEIVDFYPDAGGEEEVQENPRRRPSARRTTSLVKRLPQKWAAIQKAQASVSKIAASANAADLKLSKTKALLMRLKGRRTAQAKYARQQLQAEATRLTRRLAKLNKDLARAHKAAISAVKAANKKPAKKRSR